MTAAQAARELTRLEGLCHGVPPRRVPSAGEYMSGYWRNDAPVREESLESFKTYSDEDAEEEERRLASEGTAWSLALTGDASDD